jgi:hypothetical protein
MVSKAYNDKPYMRVLVWYSCLRKKQQRRKLLRNFAELARNAQNQGCMSIFAKTKERRLAYPCLKLRPFRRAGLVVLLNGF